MSRRFCILVIASLSQIVGAAGATGIAAEAKATAKRASTAAADQCLNCPQAPSVRAGDQVWMVSCRSMGCGRPSQLVGNLKYYVYTGEQSWQPSTREIFLASLSPETTTTFYVHGNRVDNSEARRVAANVYRSLAHVAPPDKPMQFVLWSWPSERADTGPLKDIRIKAGRTPLAGYYLGWLINQFTPDARITLIGYSFGARISTGALHLVAGGRLAGDVLAERQTRQSAIGGVLIAAAVDDNWLRPGMPHGLATTQVDRLLFINNSADSTLRHYHLLYGLRSAADAMGTYGPAGYTGGAFVIDEFDAACVVGKEHNWELYFGSPTIMRRIQPAVFASSTPAEIAKKRTASPNLTAGVKRPAARPAAKHSPASTIAKKSA